MKEIKSIQEFNKIVKGDKPVLLDFYAEWCPPCMALLPTVEKLAEKYKDDIEIVKINVDKNPEISQKFQIRSIPALFFLNEATIQEKLVGGQSEIALEEKIKKYKLAS